MRRFRFSIWPTFFSAIGVCLLLGLGTWQAGRFMERRESDALLHERAETSTLEVRSLADLGEVSTQHFRNVVLVGTFDPGHTILFKFRNYRGKRGLWLASPFQLADGAILVNRGWVPFEEASAIAERGVPEGELNLRGVVGVLDRIIKDDALVLDGEDPLAGVTYLNTIDLTAIYDALPFDGPNAPAMVALTESPSSDQYPLASADHMIQPYLTAEKHLGYAVTWYSLALALLLLYLAASFGFLGSRRS